MFAKPQSEHQWFEPLIGKWNTRGECSQGPDQPAETTESTIEGLSLGGMWIILEWNGKDDDGKPWKSLMTLGYDPTQEKYLGTFVGSMMHHLWLYNGSLSEDGKSLHLSASGPKMDGNGMADYQDSIEIVSNEQWILRSKIKNDDGSWVQFMESVSTRII